MANMDHAQPLKECPAPVINIQAPRYEPEPGDFINNQRSMQTSLYESQSLVHDGKLPEFDLLESQVNSEQKGTGTRTGLVGDERYTVTLVDGKRVMAGIWRTDGSADVARYNIDGSVDEDINTGQSAIHRHYASAGDSSLQSEEHEIRFDRPSTQVRYSDHIEYDSSGRIIASDIAAVDPLTDQLTLNSDRLNPDGSGLEIRRAPGLRSEWQTNPDGSQLIRNIPDAGPQTVVASDSSSRVLYTDVIDPATGRITHSVPHADGTITETEQRTL